MANLTNEDREILFNLYNEIEERYNTLKELVKRCCPGDYERGRVYWLAHLSMTLNNSEYWTHNPTFENFLVKYKVMTEDGEFISPAYCERCGYELESDEDWCEYCYGGGEE